MKERLSDIDRARGFAMCCVVVGHIFSLVDVRKPEMQLGPMIRFLSVFELVIFFVISGYLFYKHHESSFSVFLKKKVKGLLLPYFVFSVLNMLFFIFVEPTQQMGIPDMLVTTLSFYGISVLWFFPTLLLGETFWWGLHKKLKTGGGMLVATIMMFVVGVSHNYMLPVEASVWTSSEIALIGNKVFVVLMRGLVCLFFVGVGHCFGFLEEKWKGCRVWNYVMWLVLLGGIFITGCVPVVNLRELVWESTILWCISATLISVGIIFFFQKTIKLKLFPLEFIGKNTLLIMCTHLDFKVPIVCMSLAEILVSVSPRAKNYIYWGTLFIVLIIIEVILVIGWNLICKKGVD
ncbi:MAG: acyltransferase family protein [Lachnospiraceae bacterium]|nr:acyltransferase family protein [Lachnospiraceae bacterium]